MRTSYNSEKDVANVDAPIAAGLAMEREAVEAEVAAYMMRALRS